MPSSRLSAVARDLRRLAAGAEPGDEQLLDAFRHRRDEQAFAALVRRHAALVMGVCRRTLTHEQDAEDAFQATFLVLARSASAIRRRESLAGFLHGVAQRIARNARRALAARRRKEQRGARPEAAPSGDDLTWGEVRGLLDEEVTRLPEAYREAFVLCCLQEVSRPEAARRLGLKGGTLDSRLARAKARLHAALSRRGVTLPALAATLGLGAPASVRAATLKAAASGLVSARAAALADGLTKSLLLTKAKAATALLLFVGLIFAPLAAQAPQSAKRSSRNGRAGDVSPPSASTSGGARPPLAQKRSPASEIKVKVLDPAGKPVRGAKVYHVVSTSLYQPPGPAPRLLAETDAAGRFRIAGPLAGRNGEACWLAVAPGFGPAIADEPAKPTQAEIVLRLAHDSPLVGRVVNLEGRPLRGVSVRPVYLATNDKEDLGPLLADIESKRPANPGVYLPRRVTMPAGLPGFPPNLTTDADGRFRLTGVGRERVVGLDLHGAGIEPDMILVRTRSGAPLRFRDHEEAAREQVLHPPTFTYAAGPARPLVGKVTDRETGKPIAGVTIEVELGPLCRATTKEDGTYRLDALPGLLFRMPGRKEFVVTATALLDQPHLPAARRTRPGPRLEPLRVDFALTRGVWAEGKVTDVQTGKPVPATLDYYADSENPWLKDYADYPPNARSWLKAYHTKEDGSYRIPVLPGPGVIAALARKEGYLPSESLTAQQRRRFAVRWHSLDDFNALGRIDARPGEVLLRHLLVDSGSTLACKIVDTDWKPVTGAQVFGEGPARAWRRERLPTDELVLTGMPALRNRSVTVLHPERQLGVVVALAAIDKQPVVIKLEPTGTITGRLLDADGRPMKREHLRVFFFQNGDVDREAYYPPSVRTDDNGAFRVAGVLPNYFYRIELARSRGTVAEGVTVHPEKPTDLGDVKVRPRQE